MDKTTSLHQLFEAQAQRYPQAIALSDGNVRLTYSELNTRANQLAHYLQAQGVGSDVLVGLHVPRSMDAIISMLAILKAGGAYVPLDPAYPVERLNYILDDAKPAMLIADTHTTLAAPQVKTVLLDVAQETIRRCPTHNPTVTLTPDNLLYVIYTSGSTGKPKGVMVTHANVMRLFQATQPYLTFNSQDAWTLFHSYAFGFSVWEIWGALIHGAKLVIVPPEVSQSPDDFYQLVRQEEITVLSQTPSAFSLFQMADAAYKQPYSLNLRYIIFSGEALDPSLLEAWIQRHGDEQPQLINMYAITETAGEVSYRRFRQQDLSETTRHVIGIPLPDVHIYLLNEQQQPVADGDAGEMYISGAMIARGYLNLPELTAQRFMLDPFINDGHTRCYRTGDRARRLPTGEIEFLGREDDQVKIRGYRVELSEIQSFLNRYPSMIEAAVVAKAGPANTNRLIAYVVSHAALSANALQDYLKTCLPEYMIPASFIQLDQLPRLPNGKIDRQALLAPETVAVTTPSTGGYVAQTEDEIALAALWNVGATVTTLVSSGVLLQSHAYVAPQTPTEQAVASIWEELLSHSRIGLHDDFFELGGNSLLAAQILYRLNSQFNVNLSMRQLLDNGTVASVAALIQEMQATPAAENLDGLLADLAALSEEDLQQLLAEPSAVVEVEHPLIDTLNHANPTEAQQHAHYMRLAIDKAKEGIEHQQNPVAACIVKEGEVIASVHNAVLQQMDVTAHAEMLAIREACRKLNTLDLSGCVLYATLEPCPMCFSASHWAKLDKIVYGARRDDAMRFGLGGASISAQAIKQLGNSPVQLVADTLRDDNVKVFETWAKTKSAGYTQYDDIAEQFRQIKESPVNKYITDYTFFSMVGEQDKGKTVLDLACGEGHSCRTLKQRGASKVVGVDISLEMIRLARQQEAAQPLGIEYICQDVLKLGKVGEFDLVVASFLLNYAQTKQQLVDMCKMAFSNLKPGGRFILINENVAQTPDQYQGYERYGYTKTITQPWQEGSVITYTMSTGTEELQFKGYYWSQATCEQAFKTAGFDTIQWQNLVCSAQGIAEYGHKFWQNFLANPPFIGIIAERKS